VGLTDPIAQGSGYPFHMAFVQPWMKWQAELSFEELFGFWKHYFGEVRPIIGEPMDRRIMDARLDA